jgi:hypothetical protein
MATPAATKITLVQTLATRGVVDQSHDAAKDEFVFTRAGRSCGHGAVKEIKKASPGLPELAPDLHKHWWAILGLNP